MGHKLFLLISLVIIGLVLGLFYCTGNLDMLYLLDHHTSWLIISIQITALAIAIKEYKKWKNQAYSKSKHNSLLELFELVTRLKNGIIEFDDAVEQKKKFNRIMKNVSNKNINFISDLDRDYKLYSQLWSLYDEIISKTIVSLESKSESISNMYQLNDLHSEICSLIEQAKLRRSLTTKSASEINNFISDLTPISDEIKKKIKNESDIFDK